VNTRRYTVYGIALAALLLSGCASRLLPIPVAQVWIARLVNVEGTTVYETQVTELHPFLTLSRCGAAEGYLSASTRCQVVRRVFQFVDADRSRRVAIYAEVR
jgi:hypothetical protein